MESAEKYSILPFDGGGARKNVARFLSVSFANSLTFKGHFRQQKNSSKKYRTFQRKTA